MPKGAMRFKNMTVGRQQGELARFRVLGGPDNGVVFVVTQPRITIGRGEENDIILTDLKTSRKHAELTINGGMALLRDLGSSHGFMINGMAQKQSPVTNGDKIGLGETVLEFMASAAAGATQMIVRPPVQQTAKQVGTGNSGLTKFIARPTQSAVGAKPGMGGINGVAGQPESFLEKNKKLVLALGILITIAWMLPEAEQRIPGRKPTSVFTTKDGASGAAAPSVLFEPEYDSGPYKSADVYYKLGMRELKAKNYMRAMANFETALQIYEKHNLARLYLESTKKEMAEEADARLLSAKRDEDAARFKSAMHHYNAIKRMYTNDQSNAKWKDADAKIVELDKKLKAAERN